MDLAQPVACLDRYAVEVHFGWADRLAGPAAQTVVPVTPSVLVECFGLINQGLGQGNPPSRRLCLDAILPIGRTMWQAQAALHALID